MLEYILLFIISLLANAFSAFAGGGAGLLQLPALIFLGLPFSVALATHKLASVALGIGASARHFRERNLDWRFAVVMLVAGVPGVVLGASVILNVPDRWAELALGLLTMGLGIYSWASPDLGQVDTRMHRDFAGMLIGAGVLLAHTLVLVGLFWNGSGALTLALLGSIRWDWLPVLLAGSFLGGYIGAHYSIIKGNRAIKRAFELVTILVGLKLIIG